MVPRVMLAQSFSRMLTKGFFAMAQQLLARNGPSRWGRGTLGGPLWPQRRSSWKRGPPPPPAGKESCTHVCLRGRGHSLAGSLKRPRAL